MAGLLLAASVHCRSLDLPCPTADQIVEATGSSRSRAYELRDAVLAALPSLSRPVGRPPAPPRELHHERALAVQSEVIDFLMDHRGCIGGGAERRRYGDVFRHFVVELRERHAELDLEAFAEATRVRLGTLKDWLGGATDATEPEDPQPEAASTTVASAQIQAVLTSWDAWSGSFGDFCEHVRAEHRVPFGRSMISDILEVHGKRRPQRRSGRSPDERALRGAFETFFGGAEWVGDGTQLPVTINGHKLVFNLELGVDAFSGAFVGASIRDEEDSAAVIETLADGVAATGEAPLALLLDNKPSNHTDEVRAALGDVTIPIRATPFRPQNKAHVEGGFGLLKTTMPPIEVHADNLHDLAEQLLRLVVTTWGRTINHRPRADRGGRSRAQLYDEPVTAEQIDQARAALEERRKKQDLARMTLEARQDPTVRALLDDAFTRLNLLDPERSIRIAIARYPLGDIVDGLAIFEAKRARRSLPEGADARYLLGIVKNLCDERDLAAITDALLHRRLELRDIMLAPLVQARDAARIETPDVRGRVLRFADLALAATRGLDRTFWLDAVVDEIAAQPAHEQRALLDAAARRIRCTYRVPVCERQAALRAIIARSVPVS